VRGWALPRSNPSGRLVAAAWPTVAADGQFAPRCGQRHLGWSRMPTGPGGDRSRRRPLPGVGPRTRRRKLPDQSVAGYTEVTWAEDRATRGRDPSAEPGAKTGVGGRTPPLGIPGIGRKAINPITCICISEWRSENQGLPRARRAGKVAGSKAIMPACMRLRRTTCAALMVLQKRPCFCSPAARPDICPDLGGGIPIGRRHSRSRLPRDRRSTTESTEIHGKENPIGVTQLVCACTVYKSVHRA
jgi:hypothetical protein